MTGRDLHRSAVYAAEQQLMNALDRAGAGASVDFFGSTLTLPIERRFADLDSIRRYVESVMKLPTVESRWSTVSTPTIRERKGQRSAHYVDGVIAVPMIERWAARETVILHELAHHCVAEAANGAHDHTFQTAYVFLVDAVIGSEAALILRAALDGSMATR